ncbi:hypothetical protein Ddye_026979 [Dipteronia dyeriana]|uniref:Uncharacterized protein n=1 Tax=Dipteronia dyeriana TaxID=168575 RepID=A0AAD9TP58_9ROSI|nr:hypothetical protein Ddye_026979 [Dipteronia dyeriana]
MVVGEVLIVVRAIVVVTEWWSGGDRRSKIVIVDNSSDRGGRPSVDFCLKVWFCSSEFRYCSKFIHRAADLTLVPSAAIVNDLKAAKVTAVTWIEFKKLGLLLSEMEKYDWKAATICNEQYNAAIWFWRKKRAQLLRPVQWLVKLLSPSTTEVNYKMNEQTYQKFIL